MKALPRGEPHIVHWLWGEFASPKRAETYRRRGGRVVVSVHCSARRWKQVWRRSDGYAQADMVVLTSESQRPLAIVIIGGLTCATAFTLFVFPLIVEKAYRHVNIQKIM